MSYKLNTCHIVNKILPHNSLVGNIYRSKSETSLFLSMLFLYFYLDSRLLNLFAFDNSHFCFNSKFIFSLIFYINSKMN